jgi:ShK domain-like
MPVHHRRSSCVKTFIHVALVVLTPLLCSLLRNIDASTVKQQRTTIIDSAAQYLATAAASNKLGECLPTSTDDTNFNCFSKLRAVATGTVAPNMTSPTRPTITYVHNDACYDEETNNCPEWAASGECSINPGYMLVNCRFSCQTCYDIVDGHGGTVQVAPGSPETRKRIAQHITDTAQYIRTIRKRHPTIRATCRNYIPECTYRAVEGHCLSGSQTASYMQKHCPAACHTCV